MTNFKARMVKPITMDPLSACCGDPGDCNQAHLYCFNRNPKEANTDVMKSFDVVGPQPVHLGNHQMELTKEAVAREAKSRIEEEEEARHLLPGEAIDPALFYQPSPIQQTINEATQGSVPAWATETLAAVEKAIEQQELHLPSDSKARKETPLCTGVLDYFPKALAEVARLSKAGNDKHNPGMPLHWAREKSTDHADCIIRHMLERGTVDEFGFLHEVSVAWRALAQLEVALEKARAA